MTDEALDAAGVVQWRRCGRYDLECAACRVVGTISKDGSQRSARRTRSTFIEGQL
jgi:hypothetical protein